MSAIFFFLDAGVIVEIHILIFMGFHDSISILTVFVSIPEFIGNWANSSLVTRILLKRRNRLPLFS